MAGMRVVVVAMRTIAATSTSPTCAPRRTRTARELAALMVTYP